MRLAAFSEFEGPDFAAFVIAALLAYFVGTLLPFGPAAIYTTILLAYHLFLTWLIFKPNEKRAGVSLPLGHTVATHLACLIVLIAPVGIALHSMPSLAAPAPSSTTADPTDDPMAPMNQMAATRRTIRLIEGLCASMAAFAVFERSWLFSSEKPEDPRPEPVAPAAPIPIATIEDTTEWDRYVAANRRNFAPGTSLKAEYERWLLARHSQTTPPPA